MVIKMANLTLKEIQHIAKLSKLELSHEEEELYCEQLSSVLGYVEQLDQVETEGVSPLANVTGLENIWREDVIEDSGINYDDISKNAPEFKDGNFVVPGVFE